MNKIFVFICALIPVFSQAQVTLERIQEIREKTEKLEEGSLFRHISIRADDKLPGPAVAIRTEKGYQINFNPKIMSTLSSSAQDLIRYHELGHIILGHSDMDPAMKDRSIVETEADYFAAFLYKRLKSIDMHLMDFIRLISSQDATVPPGPARANLFLSVLLPNEVPVELPTWISKISVRRVGSLEECVKMAESEIRSLEKQMNIRLFGTKIPLFVADQQMCYADIHFGSKSKVDLLKIADAFQTAGFRIVAQLEHYGKTYMDFVVAANFEDGSSQYCASSSQSFRKFANFVEGFLALSNEMKILKSKDSNDQKKWLQDHFKCGTLQKISSFDVVMDLTNSSSCPLNSETVRTCHIARGMSKIHILLDP